MVQVSVIIPVFNTKEEYLKEAIESVLAQTFLDWELVIVDDGSTQNTNFLKTFSNPKVKIIRQENQGPAVARNNGIKLAQGKYILPLDSDDKIHPEYIEKAFNILENNTEIGIVYCDAELFGEKSGKWKLDEYKFPNILWKNVIFCSAMYKKSDWEKIGGYKKEMDLGYEDWEFWISLIEKGIKIYKLPEVLFYYRINNDSRSNQAKKFLNYVKLNKKIINFHKELYKRNFPTVFIPICFIFFKNGLTSVLKHS